MTPAKNPAARQVKRSGAMAMKKSGDAPMKNIMPPVEKNHCKTDPADAVLSVNRNLVRGRIRISIKITVETESVTAVSARFFRAADGACRRRGQWLYASLNSFCSAFNFPFRLPNPAGCVVQNKSSAKLHQ